MTRIKKAESLSIEKPNFKYEELERDNENASPKITRREKAIPNTDAIAALRKELYVTSRSFLLKTIENIAPIRKKMINPENKKSYIINLKKVLYLSPFQSGCEHC
jgi:hypothetical protein